MTMGAPPTVPRRRQPAGLIPIATATSPITDMGMLNVGDYTTGQATASMPQSFPPIPPLPMPGAAVPTQQAAAPVLDAAQVVPTTTPGEALQKGKGKRSPVIVRKAELPKAILSKKDLEVVTAHYNAVANRLRQQPDPRPGTIELAERLATMSDANLKKVIVAGGGIRELDVKMTADPVAAMAEIDRILGVKAKPKVASTPVTLVPDVNATPTSELIELPQPETATDNKKVGTKGKALKKGKTREAKPSTAPAPEPTPAAKVTPTEATRKLPDPPAIPAKPTKGEGLKKGRGPKPSLSVEEIAPPPAPVVEDKPTLTILSKEEMKARRAQQYREEKEQKLAREGPAKNAAGPPSQEQPAEEGPKESEEAQSYTSDLNDSLELWNNPKEEGDRVSAAQYILDVALFPDSNDRKSGRAAKALAAYDSMLAGVEREEGDMGVLSVSLNHAVEAELARRISEQEADEQKTGKARKKSEGMEALKKLAAKRGVLTKVITPAPEIDSAVLQVASNTAKLTAVIDEMLTSKANMQDTGWRTRKLNEAKLAFNDLRKDKLDPIIHGVKASTLFKNNRLDIQRDEKGVFRLAVGIDTAAEVMAAAADKPEGMFSRVDDGTPLTKKFAPAEVRLKVASLISRFKFKPKIAVFRSIADLKEKNPALYKRAAAARAKGDFDGTNAVGYSFGDQVLIFSDHVRSEQHLSLVVAHETLGHFGLRAFMPKSVLVASLDRIYQSDSRLREVVDQIVENTSMDRAEVVEEYLADYAAVLDNSLLSEIWNLLKNALNKLGIRFEDDHARLLVNQARRYVRNGGAGGSFFSATSMLEALERMGAEHGTGRFSVSPLEGANLSSKSLVMQAYSRIAEPMRGIWGSINYAKRFGPAEAFRAEKGVAKDIFARIAETVQSLDYRASRSEGLGDVYRLFEKQHNMARELLTQFHQLTAFTHKANWIVAQKDAPNEKDKLEASDLLGYAALYKRDAATAAIMDSYGPLMSVDEYGNLTENNEAIKRMQDDGFVTADEFRRGLKWTDSLGNEQTYPAREIDENSKYWRIYKEQRNAVNAAAMAVLRANYNSLAAYDSTVFSSLSGMDSIDNRRFTPADQEVLRKVARKFHELYLKDHKVKGAKIALDPKNKKTAENFIYEVTRLMDDKYGKEKLKDWMEGKEGTAAFQGEEFAEIRAGMAELVKMRLSDTKSNRLKQVLQNVAFSVVDSLNAEYHAKHTILTSYAPMTRNGRFQIQLKAVDADGKPVALHSTFQGVMPYYRDDDEKVATTIRDDLAKLFGTSTYKVLNSEGMEVEVTFVPEYSKARQSPDLGDVVDYSTFVHILERSSIEITPAERERLIRGLTGQGAMARANMEKTGNPGWRPDMIRNISEHLETSAHVAAKRAFRNQMDAVITDERKWKGDREKLARLRAAYKAEGLTPTQRDYLKREYDAYAFKFAEMAPAVKGGAIDIEVNGKTKSLPLRGRGEDYREEAKRLLNWQAQTLDITDSTEDILSHGWGAQAKTLTVLAQLGMSVATAIVNVGSLATHSTTYMAFYNERNGFGMGFGMAKSSMAISTALNNLKNSGFNEADFIAKIIQNGTHANYGLTPDEARFLLEQTTNGTLQPALFNALIGSARGKSQGNRINDAIQKWMFMFSYTEALNRRVTALAAYRLELARIQASTDMSEKKAQEAAATAGHNAVRISQGEYSMFNRPELARGGLGQYIFMYKMFTVITVQLMRSLPPKGRLTFLALMIAASGMKGVPFAEDLMDLVDTLAQMFGIKMTSIEKEAYQLFDAVAPGYAPYFMRGVLDQLTGSTVSSKVGMGDVIPLSGAWKYGSDPWQETKQFLGPVFGAGAGMFGWSQMIGKYGAEAVGLKSDATTFNDLLRESPLAVMRSIGDSMAYMESGAITNIRGQVVSRDVGAMTSIARLMGFYPAESTRQNDIIRISKMGGEYAKAIKADMVNAYTQAGVRGDRERMKHIAAQVIEWNISAKGTGLEIKDFQNAAKKSLTEASREAVSRFQRTVSKQMRPHVEELMRLQGVDAND